MKITMVGSRFFVETDAGRLHILTRKGLEWNLKHVFRVKSVKRVVETVEREGTVTLVKAS